MRTSVVFGFVARALLLHDDLLTAMLAYKLALTFAGKLCVMTRCPDDPVRLVPDAGNGQTVPSRGPRCMRIRRA